MHEYAQWLEKGSFFSIVRLRIRIVCLIVSGEKSMGRGERLKKKKKRKKKNTCIDAIMMLPISHFRIFKIHVKTW